MFKVLQKKQEIAMTESTNRLALQMDLGNYLAPSFFQWSSLALEQLLQVQYQQNVLPAAPLLIVEGSAVTCSAYIKAKCEYYEHQAECTTDLLCLRL